MGRRTNYHTYKWVNDIIVYKDKCFECGVENSNIHYHHIIPEVRGGKKTIPLCPTCHGRVHDRNFDNHKELQRVGIERAKLNGKYKGRKPESKESIETFLNKDRTREIINLIKDGSHGIREMARRCKCSPGLIYKIKKHIDNNTPHQ